MSGVSPSSVLFSSDGTELAVVNNAIVPAGTRALLIAGVNTQNRTDYVPASLGGALGTISMSANIPVQTAATVTASGSFTTDLGSFLGTQEVALVVNVGTVTGSGSIQYTIQEVDPQDNLTVYGSSATTPVINTGNTPGVFTAVLNVTTSSQFKVTWTVTGTFSATIYATITTKQTPSTQTVNGTVNVGTVSGTVTVAGTVAVSSVGGTVAVTQSTSPWVVSGTVTSNQGLPNTLANAWPITITDGYGNIQGSAANPIWIQGSISATNPSVGTDGAAALGFDTQVGGKVTTAAPTYTNGNLDALSLTTLGGLRIDGVYAVATANATAADVMNSGGYVTTAAPTYTTGQLNPLSLTTAGLLRIDGVYPVNATTPTTDATFVAGAVTTAAPTYTTGQMSALSLDTSGNLRVTGVVTTNKATSSSVTSVAVTANANNSLLVANATRQFASVFNGTNKTLYIKCGATASTSSFTTQLFSGSYWEVPVDWTGAVDAFAPAAASGNILVTELTP